MAYRYASNQDVGHNSNAAHSMWRHRSIHRYIIVCRHDERHVHTTSAETVSISYRYAVYRKCYHCGNPAPRCGDWNSLGIGVQPVLLVF